MAKRLDCISKPSINCHTAANKVVGTATFRIKSVKTTGPPRRGLYQPCFTCFSVSPLTIHMFIYSAASLAVKPDVRSCSVQLQIKELKTSRAP